MNSDNNMEEVEKKVYVNLRMNKHVFFDPPPVDEADFIARLEAQDRDMEQQCNYELRNYMELHGIELPPENIRASYRAAELIKAEKEKLEAYKPGNELELNIDWPNLVPPLLKYPESYYRYAVPGSEAAELMDFALCGKVQCRLKDGREVEVEKFDLDEGVNVEIAQAILDIDAIVQRGRQIAQEHLSQSTQKQWNELSLLWDRTTYMYQHSESFSQLAETLTEKFLAALQALEVEVKDKEAFKERNDFHESVGALKTLSEQIASGKPILAQVVDFTTTAKGIIKGILTRGSKEKKTFTNRELAKEYDVSESQIEKWKSGDRTAPKGFKEAVETGSRKILDRSVDEFENIRNKHDVMNTKKVVHFPGDL